MILKNLLKINYLIFKMQIEYKIEQNKPVIYIFKYKDEKRIVEKVKDFEPYFYILDEEDSQLQLKEIMSVIKGEYKSLFGEKLKKICVRVPSDVPAIRDKFKKTFEADVLFSTRYTIDKIKQIPYEKLRIHYLDIENNDSLDTKNAPEPITSITIYDNFLQKYIVFVWREDQNERNFRYENKSIYYFNNETKMLRRFIQFTQDTNPDIITGWNIENFDMPYIINRMRYLKINYNKLSPIDYVTHDKYEVKIRGRIVFDLLKGYSKLKPTVIESRKLDEIGKLELDLPKLKFEGTPGELWRKNLSKLMQYNIRDVEILKKLDDKMNILSFFDELRRLTNCEFNDTLRMSPLIDNILLTMFNNKLIFETKKAHKEGEKIKGGEVLEPVKGLHHNVLHIDLKSLYPSIMVSFNMSPETLNKNGDINVGNGTKFNSKPEGILPILIKKLWKLRDEKKKLRDNEKDEQMKKVYDRQQYCIKVIMNAIFGQTDFPKSRIYCYPIGGGITYIGRKILMATIKKLEEWNYKVIYGDTDGLFLIIDEKTNPAELVKKINKYYNEFCEQFGIKEHIFDIEYEKIYKSLILSSKKHYAGILDNGVFEVKGLETVRTDNSKFIRKLQKEILEMIMSEVDKEKIKTFIQNEIKKFKDNKYSYEDIAIPRGLSNEPHKYTTTSPWIRGCIYSQNYLKLKFEAGDKARLLYIKQMPPRLPQTYELCFHNGHEIPKGITIDIDKMLEKGVYKKLERIFELVDWNIDEILGENKSLMEF